MAETLAGYLSNLTEILNRFEKWDYVGWLNTRLTNIHRQERLSRDLEEVHKNVGITKIIGGTTGNIGGIVSIVGIATFNPFGVGAGAGISALGGSASFTGEMVKKGYTQDACEEMNLLASEDEQKLQEFNLVLKSLHSELNSLKNNSDLFEVLSLCAKGRWNIFSAYSNVSRINNARKALNFTRAFGIEDGFGRLVFCFPEISVDLTRFHSALKFTLFEAGSAGAQFVEKASAALSIFFGVLDIIGGSVEIIDGSEVSKNIKKNIKILEENTDKIREAYENVHLIYNAENHIQNSVRGKNWKTLASLKTIKNGWHKMTIEEAISRKDEILRTISISSSYSLDGGTIRGILFDEPRIIRLSSIELCSIGPHSDSIIVED